nr:hypothetical protein Iba_chr11bCG0100 [Ipomoea batatas]GME16759.1 hypothetical protein Iba_scaffold17844CG0730 [Ipomoea batatas]
MYWLKAILLLIQPRTLLLFYTFPSSWALVVLQPLQIQHLCSSEYDKHTYPLLSCPWQQVQVPQHHLSP